MAPLPLATAVAAAGGGLAALAWVAFKVGALSYGGGFVIVPLMQHDAVSRYHWMTSAQFLDADALGQLTPGPVVLTPGPVVLTVAVVATPWWGSVVGLLAAAVAFAPSFAFVLGLGRHFDRIRTSQLARAFLGGAGPAAIGAITGVAVPLAAALQHLWQFGVLAAVIGCRLAARRATIPLCLAAAAGVGWRRRCSAPRCLGKMVRGLGRR